MELLTYSEAATLTGLTNKTLQRHVKRGTLVAVDTPVGKRIPKEALIPYLGLQRDCGGHGQAAPGEAPESQQRTFETPPKVSRGTAEDRGAFESPSVPLAAHLAAIDLAKNQIEYLQRQAEEAQAQALAAERAKIASEIQIGQYQRVLAEQAESLAEERAWRQTALLQAATEVPEAPAPTLGDLKTGAKTPKRGFDWRPWRWFRGESEKTG